MPDNSSILAHIGNTPLVRLDNINPNSKVELWAKLELFNPGGSVKDRPALSMIESAEKDGRLTKDKLVLEATSGNTGIGLALVCAAKGYKLVLTMSESASLERRKILQAYGAEIRLTPAHKSTDGAIEEAYRLAREEPNKYFLVDQFNNLDNPLAHYKTTAPEIWKQTSGRITHFVATVGTSGTIMGCSNYFKEHHPEVKIIAIEPYFGHKIQGLKNMTESYRPGIFDKRSCDEIRRIEDEEAFAMCRRLAKEEGLFCGMSSGASVHSAVELCKELDSGVVVCIICDTGERYLSTPLFETRHIPTFKLYNTLTRKKEPFEPIIPGQVSMYTCGPTVSRHIHVGNCRRYVVADVLRRFLENKGLKVNHVINITDLSDRIIEESGDNGQDINAFTQKYIDEFFKDIDALDIKSATQYPRSTEYIDQMIDLTQKLLNRGYAYEKMGSIYFDISRMRSYGSLSRVDLSKIKIGKTVDLDDYEKENPRDFTLMKRTNLKELKRGIYWPTQWGNVRPSWHMECAAMATATLGKNVDIHTSSADLIFPHHENTIAVSKGANGSSLAGFWVHNEQVTYQGHKISDSLGHVTTLKDLIKWGFEGREIRFWLMSTHYRKPLELSLRALKSARHAISRLDHFNERLDNADNKIPCAELDQLLFEARKEFNESLDDDLNTPRALASVFTFIRKVNAHLDQNRITREQVEEIEDQFRQWNEVLGIFKKPDIKTVSSDEIKEIERLILKRNQARQNKDYQTADEIRTVLKSRGIAITDSQEKTTWSKV